VNRKRTRMLQFYVLASPAILGLLLFSIGPIIASFVISFTDWDILSKPAFVGFDNYSELLFQDELFRKSLWNSLYYTLFGVPLGVIGGLLVALLLNMKVKGMPIYRTLFYLPAVVPAVASAVLWIWVFDPDLGILNGLLRGIGIDNPPLWLASTEWAMPALILMSLWGLGAGMIIYLAGLQGIPEYLYEAAKMDGAGRWHLFWHVTVPHMSPIIFFNLIMGIIGSLQGGFTQAYIMTEGGPANATMFYTYYIFRKAFEEFQMGYSSALAWVLFVVILGITIVTFKYAAKKVYYEYLGGA
jgi:multiple sugar transport system permease protein